MDQADRLQERVEGILRYLNDILDKRFTQARRVNPKVATVEADIRWHQMQTMRDVLKFPKGFGPLRLFVADILASGDEAKKRDLFDPVNQVSIMNEIVPVEEQLKDRRAGQMEIRDVRTFYKALDPSLEKILQLLQTWIWWDLPDAVELYRLEAQEQKFESLRTCEVDKALQDRYRKEMGEKPGIEISREKILRFELQRTRDILDHLDRRLKAERGHEMVLVTEERDGTPIADAACINLAKRLMVIDKLRNQKDAALDAAAKQFYALQTGVSVDKITAEDALEHERRQAAIARQRLAEELSRGCEMGESANYKRVLVGRMEKRYEAMAASVGVSVRRQPAAAPAVAAAQ
jgi:hypothetical protein